MYKRQVLGAVRGVGGIDSWGTDVEEPYHVSGEEDHSVSSVSYTHLDVYKRQEYLSSALQIRS